MEIINGKKFYEIKEIAEKYGHTTQNVRRFCAALKIKKLFGIYILDESQLSLYESRIGKRGKSL